MSKIRQLSNCSFIPCLVFQIYSAAQSAGVSLHMIYELAFISWFGYSNHVDLFAQKLCLQV